MVRIADVRAELRCSPTHVSTDWSTDRVSLVETTIASTTNTTQHTAEIRDREEDGGSAIPRARTFMRGC